MIYLAVTGWLSDNFISGFYGLMLSLDAALYSLAVSAYKLFLVISSARLFGEAAYINFVERINVVLGVAMLFVVAFSILQSIVNPDNIEKGTSKLAVNIAISLVALALLSTAFDYMYKLQEVITNSNIIGKVIVGGYNLNKNISVTDGDGNARNIELDSASSLQMAGNQMAVSVFKGFLYDPVADGDNLGTPLGADFKPKIEAYEDPDNAYEDFYIVDNINYLDDVHQFAMLTGNFVLYPSLGAVINDSQQTIEYKWGLSTVAAIFICYVLISFCIDMAIRACKLAFYQLVAPIPILARIVPAGKKMFDNWLKAVISTFLEVYVKIAVVFFGVFLIQLIAEIDWLDWFDTYLYPGIDNATIFFGNVFMIIGILLFIKQAPQLLKDVFGIKDGNLALGIGKKLKDAPILGKAYDKTRGAVTGSLGSGITGMRQGGLKGFGTGLLAGGLAGGAKGGKQFGAQRNAQLQRITGNPNAKAGMFGGQKQLFNRLTAEQKAGGTSAYKARMDKKLGDSALGLSAEDVYNNAIQNEAKNLMNARRNELNSTKYDSEREAVNNHFNPQIQALRAQQANPQYDNVDEIRDINNNYSNERSAMEAEFNRKRIANGGLLNQEDLNMRTKMQTELDTKFRSEIADAKTRYDNSLSSNLERLESSKTSSLNQIDIKLGNEINAELSSFESKAQKTVNAEYNKTSKGRQFITNRTASEKATRIKDLQTAVQNIVKEEQSKNAPKETEKK